MDRVILALYAAPLLVAAGWDIASFRIPNFLNLLYLLMFPVAAMMAPGEVDWLWHLAAFGVVFVVGTLLFTLGLFGGGDVKLLFVLALWLGWDNLMDMAVWVAMGGGAVALFALVESSAIGRWLLAVAHLPRVVVGEIPEGKPRKWYKANIPYGLGICFGGLVLTPKLPLLAG